MHATRLVTTTGSTQVFFNATATCNTVLNNTYLSTMLARRPNPDQHRRALGSPSCDLLRALVETLSVLRILTSYVHSSSLTWTCGTATVFCTIFFRRTGLCIAKVFAKPSVHTLNGRVQTPHDTQRQSSPNSVESSKSICSLSPYHSVALKCVRAARREREQRDTTPFRSVLHCG